MSEALINKGVAIVGKPRSGNAPIVVVGPARGGTSMIAGALAKLGVFMGDQAAPPVFEDTRLANPMESRDFEVANKIVSEYSRLHDKWGWKRPSSIDCLEDVEHVLNSPAYVFIYKDVFSIAQRNAISMLSEVLPGMESALRQYAKSIEFLKQKSPYAMLVSYDKAVSYPEYLVDALIRFYDLKPSEQQKKAAIEFITPEPLAYLDASRITKAEGHLDGIRGRTLFGWARYVHAKNPAWVDIFLNDTKIGTVKADSPRPDLDAKFGSPCAYLFNLPDEIKIQPGDKLRARVTDEVKDLLASPLAIAKDR